MTRMSPLLALALALGACRPDTTGQPEPARPSALEPVEAPAADLPDDVLQAVTLARRVDENPSLDIDTLLQTEALSREDFDELMYEIASDPEKSRQYLQARRPAPAGAPTTELPSQDRFQ